jgi:2-polyprenyl-6-methoxyphenol hydroxylase-like FAD-dependent oxidoreductase
MHTREHFDVVIIGAGLAGLSLARQLLSNSEKHILLIEKRAEIPPKRQKVGESLVQVGGYYFSKVLDLEEYLLREHYMKYNLRFYWKSAGRENGDFEDYSQAYIRTVSNIPCYQLDRNKIEGELLRLNRQSPNFTFCAPVTDLSIALSDDRAHSLTFKTNSGEVSVAADWVVDASGRGKFLARRMGLEQPNTIRHGTSFLWVDGLVDIDKLTALSPKQLRLKQDRAAIGHLPLWLATNHFCGEGFWFWVIPLQGKTSLGLVYDNTIFPRERVVTPQKLIEWVCQEFPLFARDLPYRKILDYSGFKDYSYGCSRTIHPSRWALTGEAGRFTDPLYSPGSDFIATHNTLILDAILTTDTDELASKCHLYELLVQSLYESLVPTYAISYDALGDQEAFVLKYTWELSAYFSFFVFPFINDLATDRRFVLSYLGKFSRLGVINKHLQSFISAYYQWKKSARHPLPGPLFHDFTSIGSLRMAESMFYRIGVSVEEAQSVLEAQLTNLKELARYIVVYIHSVVLSDEGVLTNRSFIESIDLQDFRFDPAEMHERYAPYTDSAEPYAWSFDPFVLRQFRTEPRAVFAESAAASASR